jgi:hypothetical protein
MWYKCCSVNITLHGFNSLCSDCASMFVRRTYHELKAHLTLWNPKIYSSRRSNSYTTNCPFAHGLHIAMMIGAVLTSETSVNFNVTTRRYIPEDSKLYPCFGFVGALQHIWWKLHLSKQKPFSWICEYQIIIIILHGLSHSLFLFHIWFHLLQGRRTIRRPLCRYCTICLGILSCLMRSKCVFRVGFVVDNVALGQVFLRVFGFPLSISPHRRSPYSLIIREINNMSVSGSSSET